MSNSKVLEKMRELSLNIERYDYYYYSQNRSLISDLEYDRMVKELESFEKEYPELMEIASPTKTVGSSLKDSKFTKVKHRVSMLSLSNTYNIGEIGEFIGRIEKGSEFVKPSYDLELKLDGLSISIIYNEGRLTKAVTRGDGETGEDVTENILEIESIPKFLKKPVTLEVRGEIVLPLSSFEELNKKRVEDGEEIFANPRNAAAGTLRQLDREIVRKRGLDGYFYFLIEAENHGLKTHSESIRYIEELGLKTTGICENLKTLEEIEARVRYWEKKKDSLDYETDGLVLKVDELELWEELGYTAKSPRWAVAFKFPPKQVTTKLLGITWQVGRTGKVTPVAELEEVEVSGSKVKRASLHNYDEIKRKEIMVGDTVFVQKAAEIIPQVVMPLKDLRDGSEIEIPMIEMCPECETHLVKDEELVDYRCLNEICPAKIRGAIEYFVSRDGMNISGFGIKIVEKFIESGLLRDVTDIYSLKNHRDILINMDKMGEKSVDKLFENIEKSKNQEYSKVLYSLGIPSIGKTTSKLLATVSGHIERFFSMDMEELCKVEGIGEKSALEIVEFFQNRKNREIIEKLQSMGLNFRNSEKTPLNNYVSGEFEGRSFLFTGKLAKLKRDEAQKLVESFGGLNSNSVNKKLDYLVVGEDAGSKLQKAKSLETVIILTEDEFLQKINKK
ncbi:MAG: NAD-dependent DNA ligase LigA [Fusobacteriaceae bacterium]